MRILTHVRQISTGSRATAVGRSLARALFSPSAFSALAGTGGTPRTFGSCQGEGSQGFGLLRPRYFLSVGRRPLFSPKRRHNHGLGLLRSQVLFLRTHFAAAGSSGFDLACTLVNAMSENHGVKNNSGIKIIVSHDRHAACVQDLIRASLGRVCSPQLRSLWLHHAQNKV